MHNSEEDDERDLLRELTSNHHGWGFRDAKNAGTGCTRRAPAP